ncbi:MAG: hypothetical protein JW837_13985 [Sedimentisphaerales bacterium]|nr:hypothetical protein [Sedimentisphaerales bacterium]
MKRIIFLIVLLVMISSSEAIKTIGVEHSPEPSDNKKTYVLIICGINKNPEQRLAKNKAVTNLRGFFLKNAEIKPDCLNILVPEIISVGENLELSSVENLEKMLKNITNRIETKDRFVFYYIGQANIVADKLRFNLPGRDITHEKLAEWIKPIKASSMLLVLDCPGAGMAVKSLTGKGRIIIGASTAEQPYSTRFSEYFIPSLLDNESDTDGDGKISLLEAFTYASKQLDDWYFEKLFLKTETPILEDNADGFPSQQPWMYQKENTDGRQASKFFLTKL